MFYKNSLANKIENSCSKIVLEFVNFFRTSDAFSADNTQRINLKTFFFCLYRSSVGLKGVRVNEEIKMFECSCGQQWANRFGNSI